MESNKPKRRTYAQTVDKLNPVRLDEK